MTTTTKAITKFVKADEVIDLSKFFGKKKPSGVTLVMIPSYKTEEEDDIDRTKTTPKNRKSYLDSISGKNEGFSLVCAKKLVLGSTK